MKTGPLALSVALVSALTGCSKEPPIVLSRAQSAWFGSWEHVSSEYGNNIVSDNMLLVVHPDSTVSYKRCVNRMNGHSYTALPNATIRRLDGEMLAIRAQVFVFRWTQELHISRAPYMEGEDAFLEIEGVKLRRLREGESSTHDTWKCGDEDKDA